MIRRAGATLALLGFAVSTLVGLNAGNPPVVVLQRALWTLFACLAVGLIGGWVAERIIEEHVRQKERTLQTKLEETDAENESASPEEQEEEPMIVSGGKATEAAAT